MASTTVSRTVPGSPTQVWQLVGGFHSLPEWLPYIPESTPADGGRVRRIRSDKGETIVERLQEFDQAERYYSYSIEEAPFPVVAYLSTLRVHAVPGRDDVAEVQWSARFVPRGSSEAEAVELFTGIFREGLDALHKVLTG